MLHDIIADRFRIAGEQRVGVVRLLGTLKRLDRRGRGGKAVLHAAAALVAAGEQP